MIKPPLFGVNLPKVLTLIGDHSDFGEGGGGGFLYADASNVSVAMGSSGAGIYTISDLTLTYGDADDQGGNYRGVVRRSNVLITGNQTRGIDTFIISGGNSLTFAHNNNTRTGHYKLYDDGTFIIGAYTAGISSYLVDGSGNITYKNSSNPGGTDNGYTVHGNGTYLFLAKGQDGIYSLIVDGNGAFTTKDHQDYGNDYRSCYYKNGFLFVIVSGNPGRCEVYTITPNNGTMTRVQSIPVGTELRDIWVDDKYVYITDISGYCFYVYGYNLSTGALTYNRTMTSLYAPWGISGYDSNIFTAAFDAGVVSHYAWI